VRSSRVVVFVFCAQHMVTPVWVLREYLRMNVAQISPLLG